MAASLGRGRPSALSEEDVVELDRQTGRYDGSLASAKRRPEKLNLVSDTACLLGSSIASERRFFCSPAFDQSLKRRVEY